MSTIQKIESVRDLLPEAKTFGSFEFVADPTDSARCSDKCPQLKWLESVLTPEWKPICLHFGCNVSRFDGTLVRTPECLDAEKHEKESYAEWITKPNHCGSYTIVCSKCGGSPSDDFPPDKCPGCGRKMEE